MARGDWGGGGFYRNQTVDKVRMVKETLDVEWVSEIALTVIVIYVLVMLILYSTMDHLYYLQALLTQRIIYLYSKVCVLLMPLGSQSSKESRIGVSERDRPREEQRGWREVEVGA